MAAIHDTEVARLERVLESRRAKLKALDADVDRMRHKRQQGVDDAKRALASAKARRRATEDQAEARAAKRRAKVKAVA
jgi:hypothetical protein